jgi:hypothetical protein
MQNFAHLLFLLPGSAMLRRINPTQAYRDSKIAGREKFEASEKNLETKTRRRKSSHTASPKMGIRKQGRKI